MIEIEENIQRVRDRIAEAALACGRNPRDIALIAVSKNFSVEHIRAAVAAGQLQFGENRVQEAEHKIPLLTQVPGLTWHLIGHLQSNKAQRAAQLFDIVHSVDSVKLAHKLGQAAAAQGKILSVLIQVDLGKEETKFGAEADRIPDLVGEILELQGVQLNGLMTLPPFFEDAELTRPYFSALRRLRETLDQQRPGCLGRGELSMGMSHDFEIAIGEGATIVRVGTAIFGDRFHG